MFILNAMHPAIPGNVVKIFHGRPAAEKEGLVCLRIIGDYLAKDYRGCYGAEHDNAGDWEEMRDDDDVAFFTMHEFLVGFDYHDADEQEWLVEISNIEPMDGPTIPLLKPGETLPMLETAVNREARESRLTAALQCALGHIDHMTAFIGKANRGEFSGCYDFESLGEDMPEMKAALADQPRTVGELIGGVPMRTQLYAAGVELHAVLGEAIERHIYDFDNGDTIPDDCQFHAAMRGWVKACAGLLEFDKPAAPLPFKVLSAGDESYVPNWLNVVDRVGNEIFSIAGPTPDERQNALAMVGAVNALHRAPPTKLVAAG